jgi:hypothetical protein
VVPGRDPSRSQRQAWRPASSWPPRSWPASDASHGTSEAGGVLRRSRPRSAGSACPATRAPPSGHGQRDQHRDSDLEVHLAPGGGSGYRRRRRRPPRACVSTHTFTRDDPVNGRRAPTRSKSSSTAGAPRPDASPTRTPGPAAPPLYLCGRLTGAPAHARAAATPARRTAALSLRPASRTARRRGGAPASAPAARRCAARSRRPRRRAGSARDRKAGR